MDHSNIYPFKTKPYAHQATAWAMSKEKDEFALFMEMGTGKTKVAIDSIAYLYDSGRINSALIVAPKGVYMNWVNKEIPTHLPDHIQYKIASWHASPRKAEQEALDEIMRPSDDLRIFIMNVEAFSTDRGTKFAKTFMDIGGRVAMIVDESTTIKNPGAQRTKNVIRVGTYAKYRRILTGEPVTRSPLDVYSQAQFLNPHLLGFSSYYTFRNRYAIMVDIKAGNRSFKKIVGFKQLEELTKLLQRFSYRVKKADCLDLPDKVYQYRYVELSKEQKQIYKQLSDTAIASLQGKAITVDNVLTEILRLHQITCGHFKSDDGTIVDVPNNRLDELMDVLEEAGDKVIIWATYVQDIRKITEKLAEVYGPESVVTYYGATSTDDEIDWGELDRVSRTLASYKKIHKLMDFTDLLEQWLKVGMSPKLDAVFVDEAQDLSALQWDFVEKLTEKVEDRYVAGDDDQAIYRWAGADVERLIHLPGRRIVLDQSYRVPIAVHRMATNLLSRIPGRVPKRFKPADVPGSVNWHFDSEEVDLSKGQWLLLSRNSYLNKGLEDICLRNGYPFQSLKHSPLENDSLKAIIAWTRLCAGKTATGDEVRLIYRFMGIRKRTDKERIYELQELKLEPGIWHERLIKIPSAEREYYISARRQGESLIGEPRIKINTIHAVKGGEADNVLLLTDMAARSYKYMQQYPDDETRVFYVGMTRAKQNLHLVQPQTNLFYEIG